MIKNTENSSLRNAKVGSIEVICGSMFSGKTEELLRRLKRAQIAKLDVQIFKPKTDTRYHETDVVSHNANSAQAISVETASAILIYGSNAHVIGIDEAQFFDDELPIVCQQLANKGIRVILAGLDMDFEGKPFGTMPILMAIAEEVTKVHAVCMRCGDSALYSYRLVDNKNQLLLGEKENYEPLCRTCYNN
ncbi:MAG: thymidine kinase [Sphingobacteriales bacterium]|nr:MAG: thymidine kinase [Sphingobacteriales bacterium]